jgi:hypothetical protein
VKAIFKKFNLLDLYVVDRVTGYFQGFDGWLASAIYPFVLFPLKMEV